MVPCWVRLGEVEAVWRNDEKQEGGVEESWSGLDMEADDDGAEAG